MSSEIFPALCSCGKSVMIENKCWLCYYITKLGEVEGREYFDKRFGQYKKNTIVSDGRQTIRIK